jgi:hypothetical protein
MISILTKSFVTDMLETAQDNLSRDGYLVPVLMVKTTKGKGRIIELRDLMRAKNHQQKRLYIATIGKKLQEKDGVKEALLFLEGWYVDPLEPGALQIPPSEHPARREAIVVIGRNAKYTRTTMVVQPFTRDKDNKPVWEAMPIARYNQPSALGSRPMGLLDYLFGKDGTH